MDSNRLNKIIERFWQSKNKNDIYHLGRCADFAYALKQFLGNGEYYMVGDIPEIDVAWHVVLKYNGTYWDVRGPNTIKQIKSRNPIVAFNDDNKVVSKAGSTEIQHIIKLLNMDFVNDTIEGLKKAEKEVK